MHGPQFLGRLFALLFRLLLALGCSAVLFVVHAARFCELCAATVQAYTRSREQFDAGAAPTATVIGAGAAVVTALLLVLLVLACDQSEQRVPSCILASDTACFYLSIVRHAEAVLRAKVVDGRYIPRRGDSRDGCG